MRKRYGDSRIDRCPFCGQQALTMNSQGIPVCIAHKGEELTDLRCACGEYLDVRKGKFGVFFSCFNCGAKSLRKVLEMNPPKPRVEKKPQEFIVRSDDPRFFD
ncbi:MAG: hypothetical protein ABH879_07290 [archaeon]